MKKVFLSVLMLAGIVGIAMADHQETLTVTVPADANVCYVSGTFCPSIDTKDVIPMDLQTVNGNGTKVFTCTVNIPDGVDFSGNQNYKYRFFSGYSSDYKQDNGVDYYYYYQGFTQEVTKFKQYASQVNIVRFTCSSTVQNDKVFVCGNLAGASWSESKMMRMVLVDSTQITKTFQARIGSNSDLEYKFFIGARNWNNQVQDGNYKFKDRTKDANGATINDYIIDTISVPAGTKEVYYIGNWGGKGESKDRAYKCVDIGNNKFVGVLPSTEEREFRCYNKANTEYYEASDANGTKRTRKTTDTDVTSHQITVDYWRPIQYYVTGSSNLGHDSGKGDSWDNQQLKMNINGTITLTNRAVGNYEMKVTDGNWGSEHELDYTNLDKTASAASVTQGSGNTNICFYLTAQGDVNISVVNGKVIVTGSTIGEKQKQYYIAGANNLSSSGDWDAKRYTMEANGTKTINLPAGERQMKIGTGNWDNMLTFADLNTTSSSPYIYTSGTGGNICFYLTAQGDVNISVVAGKVIVTGSTIGQQPAPFTQFYIAGGPNLGKDNWNEKRYTMGADSSITITDLTAGEHQMKIGTGNWDNLLGYSHLDSDNSSPYIYTKGDGNNIYFYMTETGNVTVKVVKISDSNSVRVTGQTIGEKPLQYYLTGIDGWGVTQHSLDMTTRSYKKEKLNAGDYQCKITDGSWDNTLKYADVNQSLSNIALQEGDTNNIKFHLDKKTDMLFQVKDGKVVVNQLYYITGSFNNNWSDNFLSMDTFARSYTKELAAGAHEFKVYGTKGWNDHELKYENVSKTLSSPNVFTTNGNIGILLAEAGQVTIQVVDGDSVVVTGNFSPTATYTLEGNGGSDNTKTWCHGKDWNTSASQMYGDTIRFHNVPAGTWKCKVTNLKKEFEWGYNEVVLDASSCQVKCESVQDNGIRLEVPYVSDIAIRVVAPDAEKKIVVYVSPAVLDEEEDNSSMINAIHDKKVDAQLKRSFIADGYWYTLCLPFSRSEEQVQTELGACQLMKLNSSYLKSSDMLYLDFEAETAIEAGVPYLFMPEADVENPIFHAVTADKNASKVVETDKASMTGFYQPTVVEATNYFLGDENYLKRNNDESISKAFRAYFTLNDNMPAGVMARAVFGHSTPTDLKQTKAIEENSKIIVNGHLYILRAGARYTITGQRL